MKLTKEILEKTRDVDDGSFLFDEQIEQILQDQKLRELVDKMIQYYKQINPILRDSEMDEVLCVLETLVEDSKK